MKLKRSEIGGTKDFKGFSLEGTCSLGKFGGMKFCFSFVLRETLRFHFERMKTACVSKKDIMYKAAFVNVIF